MNLNRSDRRYSTMILLVLINSLLLLSCKNYHRNSAHPEIPESSIENGELSATKYCQSCHLLPDPSLLNTKSWEKGVLPQMGPRLGIFSHGFNNYPSMKFDQSLDRNYYPSKPLLTVNEWQDILNYFIATSPDSLPPQNREHPIKTGLPLFTVEHPEIFYEGAATSYVKIFPGAKSSLIISDAIKQNTYFINNELQITDSVKTIGAVVDIDFSKQGMLACNIGVLNPNNGKYGRGQFLKIDAKGRFHIDSVAIINNLQRPVQLTSSDLNNDGKHDLLICEFGYLTGSLSWMENKDNNIYNRHVLRPLPGAIKAYIEDYNHDGLPDIWVLFAQGEEGIFLYTNKGGGNFEQQQVLRFPPVYGSSYFELADFNKDGFPDIVYTCGDNADYSLVFKPYHGVYIFMNDKTNHFVQKFFFPINGCYKALARDFDNDGDLDIAAISFFADYLHQPEEGFVYLNNTANLNFMPFTLEETKSGRWLVMDAGDINSDGKIDIVLGNFSIKPAINKSNVTWKKSPPFIVLKNTGN